MPPNRKNKFTPKNYVDAIKDIPTFLFDPKGWIDCHGDGKSTTKAKYIVQCNGTSTGEYQVRIWMPYAKQVALGPITLAAKEDGTRPDDEDVLAALREAVAGLKK